MVTNTDTPKINKPMNAILLILLGTVTLSVVAFLVLLLTKFSMEDADWWLKILSGVVAALTVLAGLLAIFTGHVVNTRQGEKMTTLETRLEEQKERTANAERKAAEIEQQNLKLRLDLDAANRKRVRLEDDLEPRRLRSVSSGIIKERLEKFAGTKFILHVIADDEEARDAASIVSGVLTTYGWKLIAAHEVPLTKLPSGAVIIDKGNFTAAKELHEYLQANRWKSVMHLTVRLPGFWEDVERYLGTDVEGVVCVQIARKPMSFFWEKANEERDAKLRVKLGIPDSSPDITEWREKNDKEYLDKLRKEWGFDD